MLDVTRKNIGLKVGVVINGQLLSVAMIAGGTAHVWIAGLPQNTAESLIGAFQRLHRERWVVGVGAEKTPALYEGTCRRCAGRPEWSA